MTEKITAQRWWDFPAALLTLAAMLTAASRLVATRWTSHLDIVQTLAFFGVILGLALGQSRFSSRIAAILAFAYGTFFIPYQMGLFLKNELLWMERLSILANRLSFIVLQLVNREPVQDSLLFLLLMSVLFWGLSVHAGYTLVRYGNAWQTVLPGGLAMFVIHSFDPLISRRAWYLTVYLFFALVLVARVTFLHQHNRWKISQTALPPHLGLDILRFTILATSVIVLFAWTVPALANAVPAAERAWQPVRRAWNETRDRFDNAFASLRSSVSPVSEYYGRSALLGRGNPLSDTQMFSVNIPADIPTSLRIYWRARTYDTFERGQWLSTVHLNHAFNPENDNLRVPESQGRWLGSFEFVSATHMITLFTPAQPLWVNRPGQVEYAKNPDGTLDIATFRAVPSLEPGQVYKAQASVNHASLAELRAAGNEYPSWVTERYLQLPDTITSRTRQLAEEITAGLDTPYDKVNAVTNYLRENITYVDTIDQVPPRDQEIIDWFLFDLKQGFCNYYSTAEIVLLRSLGIPARWAIGFAQGERVAEETVPGTRFEENSYIVRQRDAHAWPEIYFPGIGWVEFEPTTSQPEIARLTGEDRNGDPNLLSGSNGERQLREYEDEMALLREERLAAQESQQNRSNVVYWLLAWALVGGSLIYLVWRFRSRINITATPIMLEAAFVKIGIRPPKSIQLWARSVELPPLVKAYTEINRALSRLGESPAATRTPAERAEHLAQLIPSTDTYAQRLVNEYQIGIFSRQLPNLAVALRSATEIRRQSLRAFLQRLFARLQRPLRFTR